MDPSVWLGVLGTVRARHGDTELDLGGRQLPTVLGLLLVRAGKPVTWGEFTTLLWDDSPPAGAENILQRHIGALRRILEPGLPPRAPSRWLQRSPGGYRLAAGPESLDLLRFRQLAEQGSQAAAAGDAAAAAKARTAALQLWRGRCGSGIEVGPALSPEFSAVDRERVDVLRAAVDDALASGELRGLLPVVQKAAAQDGLNEAVQAPLILLLAASGRQAAAVAAYQALRSRLAEDLGVDPGPEVRAAYDRVLRQEVVTAPAPPPPAVGEVPPLRSVPSQLPAANRFFTGRAAELAQLSRVAAEVNRGRSSSVIVTIDGLPGVGKTLLALHWAHQMTDRFPDGQLFVDLRGFDPTEPALSSDQALIHLLAGLGVPDQQMPVGTDALSAMFRAMVNDRRFLIVLDNVRDEEQVRPLVPVSPGSLVLITSRARLTGLVVTNSAVPLSLSVMSLEECRVGARERIGTDRFAGAEDALDEIIKYCGRLPLAMAIVSARALANPQWSAREIADELRAAAPLDFLDGEEPRSDVRNVFSWSYRMLSEPAARLFRLLPLHPGPDIGTVTAAKLAGLPPETVRRLVQELTRTRLLTEVRPSRYAFHDLIKAYAAELGASADTEQERATALTGLLDYLLLAGDRANRMMQPAFRLNEVKQADGGLVEPVRDTKEAMAWFTSELTVLEAAVDLPGPRSWRLAELLIPFYQRLALYQRWESTAGHALSRAESAGDLEGQAAMHRMIAGSLMFAGSSARPTGPDPERLAMAARHLQRTLELFDALGKDAAKAEVYRNIGMTERERGQHDRARSQFERALALFEAQGDRRGMALSLLGLARERAELGDLEVAADKIARAETFARELDDVNTTAAAVATLAHIVARMGRLEEALVLFERAEELFRQDENRGEMASNDVSIGDLLAEWDRLGEAVIFWSRARDRYAELGQSAVVAVLDQRLAETAADMSSG
ncbi:BTAD domain-containing putative transcriptional regulator [Micromonospora sp. NPDC048898]|uniref:AfsR/SARP family transcriptional regulator n=1 Tax=Micromonospora sp. NPDC048898 TaxID=3364260 RepID=UPI00371A62AF